MTEEEVEGTRERYISCLEPLFLPADPVGNNIVNLFCILAQNRWDGGQRLGPVSRVARNAGRSECSYAG